MPHQCTDCGRTFADGSKEMLSGCPDCGGNKFQFKPDGRESPPEEDPPEPPEPAVDNSVARTVGNAATAVRDLVGSDSRRPPGPADTPAESSDSRADAAPGSTGTAPSPHADASTAGESSADSSPAPDTRQTPEAASAEDTAQASARTDVVSPDELPPAPEDSTRSRPAPVMDESTTDESGTAPNLDQLREELNEQFESIRVLEPGQYELNLMELYNREEYIIALQEDGKYTIQVPERWEEA